MKIQINLNGQTRTFAIEPGETLMALLRRSGVWSVKHGCETGECGACSVLVDGKLMPTCVILAAQMDGRAITTVEAFDNGPGAALDPIQQAFAETGAIQCGFCTPAMVLAARQLLSTEPNPTEAQVRDVLGGVLCRCTGYVKPVEAVLRAAAVLRGESVPPIDAPGGIPLEGFFDAMRRSPEPELPESGSDVLTKTKVAFIVFPTVDTQGATDVVGRPEMKVDAVKLVKGKPVFADDIELPGMLHAAMLTSPHAHARITRIDASKARALPGVHAVLTYEDVPRVIYASGGQTWPNPHPWDQVSLDNKVRHVGDRVAVVAAESPEIAWAALDLIEVEYDVLPAVFDPIATMQPGAPIIHDEPDAVGVADVATQHRCDHPCPLRRCGAGAGRGGSCFRAHLSCTSGAAGIHRAAHRRHLLGRRRAHGDPHQHPGALPRAPHDRPADRAAGQAHPRDQAAHRRRLRRQAGDVDRRSVCAPDHCDRPAGAF